MTKHRKRIIELGIITIIIAILITIGFYFKNPEIYHQEIKENYVELPVYDQIPAGDLVGNRDAKQTFTSEQDTINAISIGVHSGGRENDCHVTVELQDVSTNEICESWKFNGKRIPDSGYMLFQLKKPLKNTKGKLYEIKIYSKDERYKNAISVVVDVGAVYEDGQLFIAGEKVSGAMMLKITYANDKVIVYKNTANLVRMGVMIFIYLVLFELTIWKLRKLVNKLKKILPEFFEKNVKEKKNVWFHFVCYIIAILFLSALLTVLLQFITSGDMGWNGYFYMCFVGFCMTGVFVFHICKSEKAKPELVFLVIAFMTGIIYFMEVPVTT